MHINPSVPAGSVSRRLAMGGQSLVARPLLNVALQLFRRCGCCALWMPNDPYHLAHAPARTASRRSPVRGGRSLAVSAAAVANHVGDNWYGACHLRGLYRQRGRARPTGLENRRSLRLPVRSQGPRLRAGPERGRRLLPQPGGFEGFGVIEVVLLPNDLAVFVERRQHGVVVGQRDAAALSACDEFAEHQKSVAEVDQLPRLEPMLTPAAGPIGRELTVALQAPVAPLEPKRVVFRVLELHIRVIDQDTHVQVSTVVGLEAALHRSQQKGLPQTGRGRQPRYQPRPECRQRGKSNRQPLLKRPRPLRRFVQRKLLAHNLDVLLRHRLLPQPHGFEGFGWVRVGDDAADLAAPPCPDQRDARVKRNPARLRSPGDAVHGDRPTLVRLVQFREFEAEGVPDRVHVLGPLPHAFDAAIAPSLRGGEHGAPLQLRLERRPTNRLEVTCVQGIGQGLDPAAPVRRPLPRLRHRPPSIPPGPARRSERASGRAKPATIVRWGPCCCSSREGAVATAEPRAGFFTRQPVWSRPARRPMSRSTATAPVLISRPTTSIPSPAQMAQSSFIPALASTSMPRAASAFITTAVHRPNSASQVSACSPGPSASATQKSCSPGGARGVLPSCTSNSGLSPSNSMSSSRVTLPR